MGSWKREGKGRNADKKMPARERAGLAEPVAITGCLLRLRNRNVGFTESESFWESGSSLPPLPLPLSPHPAECDFLEALGRAETVYLLTRRVAETVTVTDVYFILAFPPLSLPPPPSVSLLHFHVSRICSFARYREHASAAQNGSGCLLSSACRVVADEGERKRKSLSRASKGSINVFSLGAIFLPREIFFRARDKRAKDGRRESRHCCVSKGGPLQI